MSGKMKTALPTDHRIICKIIEPGSTVLDMGCGNGDLLELLRQEKKVKGQGIELNESAIFACVEKGLSVFHMVLERYYYSGSLEVRFLPNLFAMDAIFVISGRRPQPKKALRAIFRRTDLFTEAY
jgi:SAM-dependent methyltransferase